MVWVEIAIRPMRSPSSVAIGASSTGGRSTSMPGSAMRKVLTHLISGNSRSTCRKERRMPMIRTATMTPFRPGLAREGGVDLAVENQRNEAGDDQEDDHPPQVYLRGGELVRIVLARTASSEQTQVPEPFLGRSEFLT